MMRGQGRTSVTVDFCGLRFMNSASFKYFVSWIKTNDADKRRYTIRFLLNPAHHWQEVSIHALSCFSMDTITIEKADASTL
jgi:hypothetical protein